MIPDEHHRKWRTLPGSAVVKDKGIILRIHPRNHGVSDGPSEIHFRPIRKGRAEEAREQLKAFAVWDSGREQTANAADIAWVAGRLWFESETTQPRERVMEWLDGKCESCGCASAHPSLLECLAV